MLQASQEGIDFLGETPNPPQTSDEVIQMWRENLTGGARRMFDVLVENYPNSIPKDQLGEMIEMVHTSGSFSTYLSMLRGNGVAQSNGDGVKASDNLFI